MKNILALSLFVLAASAHAGNMENTLAKAMASPELDSALKTLNTTRAAKDYRGWGGFELTSATVAGSVSEADLNGSVVRQGFQLVYENHYEHAQRAEILVTVTTTKHVGKATLSKVEVEVQSVEETDGPILK